MTPQHLDRWRELLDRALELDLQGRLGSRRLCLQEEADQLRLEAAYSELELAGAYARALALLTANPLPTPPGNRLPSPRLELGLIRALCALLGDESQSALEIARYSAALEPEPLLLFAARLLGESMPEMPLPDTPLAHWLQRRGNPAPAAPLAGTLKTSEMVGWYSPGRESCAQLAPRGLGTFAQGDVRLCNYGPHQTPLGEPAHFGLDHVVGKPTLAAHYGSYKLGGDVAVGRGWLELNITFDADGLSLTVEQLKPQTLLFAFFLQGERCLVDGNQIEGLNAYRGPSKSVELCGNRGGLTLQGPGPLEVIPLAGDGEHWHANYLAAYTLPPRGRATFTLG